ncbi:hypothetical protein DSO57_1009390 [Entomophthora muscae]|uniref:Uncharacterized protein n=1 Tax=Entomophthora muscae TaxID=34485 RepID=A0ACC2T6U3_9FUNG|nr:hypothetical protein DSO57_1009390 [Entomophthora muscae]
MEAQRNGNFQASPNSCSAGGSHEFEDSYTTCGIIGLSFVSPSASSAATACVIKSAKSA